jgi:periplasmic protein TonB
MSWLAAEELADLRRWAICGAVVMLAHGAIAAALVNWRDPLDAAEPSGAIVVEFAPEAVAPVARETNLPPGPEQVQSDAAPEKPVEKVEEEKKEIIESKSEDAIPEKTEVKPVEQQPREAAPVTTAPAPSDAKIAALPAAPVQGQPTDSKAVEAYVGRLSALLERHKRYPKEALSRREQGVAQVFFSLDRQGRVIDSRIVRSSGSATLDAEALALLQRAQPFPAWPAGQSVDHLDLTVPVRFLR